MRISVVTPSFNLAPYLEQTIASVIANLREGDEYFVIDGGSTDGSVDIIRRYEDRLSGWISEPDAGYADAIGKGFARASGDVLCWINCSDEYLTGALDVARQEMLKGSDLIFGNNFYIDENRDVLFYSDGWVPDLRFATLYGGWTPLQDACFWRRDLYETVGGIDRTLQFSADYDLFLRMALHGKSEYVPWAFSGFRRHAGQKSISGQAEYQAERRQCRARELKKHATNPLWDACMRIAGRCFASARARVAPLLWRRPAVVGVPIDTLPCAQY